VCVVAENVDDIDRSFLDNVRVMCDGASQIAGFDNAMGQTVRHSCHLFPDVFRAMLTLVTVLFADYGVMNCVCKQGEEQKRVAAIDEQCMVEMLPSHWRVWMLEQRKALAGDAVAMCGVSMDYANERLLLAFDPVSARLVRLVDVLQGLLNYIIVLTRLDTGNCNDYASSYMVSLMPEPADYFMPCMNTADCRLKCLDTYRTFEAALQASTAEPVFVSQIETVVESKYFSHRGVAPRPAL